MSAIFGIMRLDGAPVEVCELNRMGRQMAHCGPDGREVVAFDTIGLGACLMRVNHEDRHEAQPLHDHALGVILVADLRLDNREAIAAGIGIAHERLATMADSALLLEAWRAWGEHCVDHLIGDFAFALWDHRRKCLFLVRDHMGQRGLFIHRGPTMIAFATEAKALFALAGVPRRLDEVGFGRRMLRVLDPDPGHTLFVGVAVLPGGCLRKYEADGTSAERRYWQPHPGAQHVGRDDGYYIAAYRRIVEEAIACRVRRLDAAPGLLFSGGFDSGTIAAIAAPIVQAQGRDVVAVAMVLPEGEAPAAGDARTAVAAFEGTAGLSIRYLASQATVFDDAEANFAREDGPLAVLPSRRLAYRAIRAARARLVIDGHGGDYTVNVHSGGWLGRILRRGDVIGFGRELRARQQFTGWTLWTILRNEVVWPLIPAGLVRFAMAMARGMRPQWQHAMTSDSFAAELISHGKIVPGRLRNDRVPAGRWHARWRHLLHRVVNTAPHQTPAAIQGLVLTRPFHDPRIVELGQALPDHLHFRNGRERWLARHVFADVLPAKLIARKPGNDLEDPAMVSANLAVAPAELAASARGSTASRFVDFAKVAAALRDRSASKPAAQQRALSAATALVMARFVVWLDPSNEKNQEP